MKHFITLADFSAHQIISLINKAQSLKDAMRMKLPLEQTAATKSLAMIFSKRSTRTRLAVESGFSALGGHPIFLGSQDVQLGVNESLKDTARVVSSMNDLMVVRCGAHKDLLTIVENATCPVVNALTDLLHPTQILADLMTMHESLHGVNVPMHVDSLANQKVAWIGDANNVLNSMILAFSCLNIPLSIAVPESVEVSAEVMQQARGPGTVTITHSPKHALLDANFIVTDTWISMGQESSNSEARMKLFSGFQITRKLIGQSMADSNWKFLHCLPRKSHEVDDDVFYSKQSLAFEEAENRKYTMMAVFDHLLSSRA